MNVPFLPPFDEADDAAVNRAFAGAPVLPFGQAWREEPEPGFRGGRVRLGWNAEGLWVLAEMEDDLVFTQATADNQPLWTLGDVFEIFVRDLSGEEYFELHTAPTGHRLSLRLPSGRTIADLREGRAVLEDMIMKEPAFRSRVFRTDCGWGVLACVMAVKGRALRASFGRYDYRNADAEPVLSSSSAHKEADYHRQEEWRDFQLVESC